MAAERIFNSVPPTAPDAIFGIQAMAEKDARPGVINATSGELYLGDGYMYTPSAVKRAHAEIGLGDLNYVTASEEGWLGKSDFVRGSAEIVLGSDTADELIDEGKIVAVGTPGGTGALFLFAEALRGTDPDAKVLLSDPTWPNHNGIFEERGFEVLTYSHLSGRTYNLEAHLKAINESPKNTVVLFHGGRTHNPTGDNPKTTDEWQMLAEAMQGRFALFDAAYAGWGDGLSEDTEPIRIFQKAEVPFAIALSNSKNGGMYSLRTGLFMTVVESREKALEVQSYLNNRIARRSYSNPTAIGEELMGRVFTDPSLRKEWEGNLEFVRATLAHRRDELAKALGGGFDYIREQRGLFGLLPLSSEQVGQLREQHGIYVVGNGRINLGSLKTPQEIALLAAGVKKVI